MDKNILIFVAGGLFTATIQFISTFFTNKREREESRKDKYFFVCLEKRFEAHQKALYFSKKLNRNIPYGSQQLEKAISVLKEIESFMDEYSLYLSPKIRDKFKDVIEIYNQYPILYDCWQNSQRENIKEKEKAAEDLKTAFSEIANLHNHIEEYINTAFWYIIENDKPNH